MSQPTRVSVVVSTYNRAAGLRATLEGLRYQTYRDLEVVVVNGPSTDDTAAVLAEYAGRVRAGSCAEQSLTRSRNVGITLASGDVVAFIDDDAIPEPTWVADLVAGYDAPAVAGVGGIVYDHTGLRLQYRYSVCTRIGEPRWDVEPPLERYLGPGCDPFLYLQGTNQSYRRGLLVDVGGFDESLEHYFDDTEIAMQLIDAGHRLRAVPRAGVHHKYLASSVRDHQRVLVDPYRIIKDRFRFALLACRSRPTASVTDALVPWAETMREGGRYQRDAGGLTAAQFERYSARVDEAVAVSLEGTAGVERPRRAIPEPDPAAFVPYPTVRAEGRRLTVCFLSKEYPPDDFGGVGRLTADFAREFTARGHEVHVVTETRDVPRVDFEQGVWVHRLELVGPLVEELADQPLGANLALVRAMYGEVSRIHERGPVDVVVGALWLASGMMCSLDPRFATVLLLESGTRTIADFHPSWESQPAIRQLITLEGLLFRHARYLHAISADILQTVQAQYGVTDAPAFVLPLGRRDRHAEVRRTRGADGRVRILFVSRLERRKGVDVLLPVAVRLVQRHPQVEFVLAGKDTEHTELGETYTAAFRREFGHDPDLTSRIRFPGWLSEQALDQAYADADVFCLPARYESLGLVVIEAMAFGLPIVTSDAGGLVEIVETEQSGVLVPVEDGAALETALGRLIEDVALRRRMGERSRRRFEEAFDLARTIPQTIAALTRVAEQHDAGLAGRPVDRETARAAVARELPGIVGEVTGVAPERARRIAAALLEESWEGRRVVETLKRLWSLPDQEFVASIFPLLLERPADAVGLRHWTLLLGNGGSRMDVVRTLAESREAKDRGKDTAWLPALVDAIGANGGAPGATSIRRASVQSRTFLAKLPSYLSNAAYLPTNVRELRTEAARVRAAQERLEHALLDAAGRQTRAEERQAELEANVLPGVDETRARTATLLARMDAMDAHANALGQQVSGGLTALAEWVSLLQKKMEMMALDLREHVTTRQEGERLPEPQIVDPEELHRKLAASGGRIRLNLGCGEKPLDGYVNVDLRAAPYVDVVADARRVPFGDGSVSEIASSHLVEHFRRHQFATVVLPYWSRLLSAGGVLRTVCPNWQEMLRRLHRGEMTMEDFTTVTFGAQDYCGDDHFAMYTPQTFVELLERFGFRDIEVVTEARQNGLCPEMEVIARKATDEERAGS